MGEVKMKRTAIKTAETFSTRFGLSARVQVGRDVFVRFRDKWEYYQMSRRGIEMFIGYVEEPAQVAVLQSAVANVAPKYVEQALGRVAS